MNIDEKIKALIPFVGENFITFPLWEEGDYRPTVNIWQIVGGESDFEEIELKDSGYYKFTTDKIDVDWEANSSVIDYERNIVSFRITGKEDVLHEDATEPSLDELLDKALEIIKYTETNE